MSNGCLNCDCDQLISSALGPQGPTGPQGPQGDPGAAGPAGPAGADGNDGIDGAYGGFSSHWVFDTDTTSPPDSNKIELNNANPAAVTQIYISDTNADSIDMSPFINTFNDSANYGFLRLFKRDDSSIFSLYRVTNLTDNTTFFTIEVSYLHHNGTLSNSDEAVLTFVENGEDGAATSDGYVWADYAGSLGPCIPNFDIAADADKIDILIAWLCTLNTQVTDIEGTALIAQDQEFDITCKREIIDGTGTLSLEFATVSVDLAAGLTGPYPIASYTIDGLAPSFPHTVGAGGVTLTQPVPGSTWVRATTNGTLCSSSQSFTVQFTDTEGNVSNVATITFNISGPIVFDDNNMLYKTLWTDHNNADANAIIAPSGGAVTMDWFGVYRYFRYDTGLHVTANFTVGYVATPTSGAFDFKGPDIGVNGWGSGTAFPCYGLKDGTTTYLGVVVTKGVNDFSVTFVGYAPTPGDQMQIIFNAFCETGNTWAEEEGSPL